MHTDPVADLLTRIRNGARARLSTVSCPQSKLKLEICRVLKEEGYIADFQSVPDQKKQGQIDITLRYNERRQPVINSIRRVSKPGLRKYLRSTEIPRIRTGLGIMILTTSRGVLTDRACREQGVGGEALCAVY
ncbi:MAG: 30S ribosomal protein S8 [Myxococcota bacterium]